MLTSPEVQFCAGLSTACRMFLKPVLLPQSLSPASLNLFVLDVGVYVNPESLKMKKQPGLFHPT
jgi:hypothetical protein